MMASYHTTETNDSYSFIEMFLMTLLYPNKVYSIENALKSPKLSSWKEAPTTAQDIVANVMAKFRKKEYFTDRQLRSEFRTALKSCQYLSSCVSDVDHLENFFKTVLTLKPFNHYCDSILGTFKDPTYIHKVNRVNGNGSWCQSIESMLKQSFTSIKLTMVPFPMLLIQVPRSTQELVPYYPELTLDLAQVSTEPSKAHQMELVGIVCKKECEYLPSEYFAYIRDFEYSDFGLGWLYAVHGNDCYSHVLGLTNRIRTKSAMDKSFTDTSYNNLLNYGVLFIYVSKIINDSAIPGVHMTSNQLKSQETIDPDKVKSYAEATKEPAPNRTGTLNIDQKPVQTVEPTLLPLRTSKVERSDSDSHGGLWKGIEGYNNSCYMDVLLMSMFYSTTIFDETLVASCKKHENELVNTLLKLIAGKLRNPPHYCEKDLIWNLREALGQIEASFATREGAMLDVDEMIILLFRRVLQLNPFIRYESGTTNYLHQIMLDHNTISKQRGKMVLSLQTLFDRSMMVQRLSLAKNVPPYPALLIKVPRSNGKLMVDGWIVPPLHLKVEVDRGSFVQLELISVICIRNCHYTAFIKNCKDQSWIYFDSLAPAGNPRVLEVSHKLLDFEKGLNLLEEFCGTNAIVQQYDRIDPFLQRLINDVHLCIYASPGANLLGLARTFDSQVERNSSMTEYFYSMSDIQRIGNKDGISSSGSQSSNMQYEHVQDRIKNFEGKVRKDEPMDIQISNMVGEIIKFEIDVPEINRKLKPTTPVMSTTDQNVSSGHKIMTRSVQRSNISVERAMWHLDIVFAALFGKTVEFRNKCLDEEMSYKPDDPTVVRFRNFLIKTVSQQYGQYSKFIGRIETLKSVYDHFSDIDPTYNTLEDVGQIFVVLFEKCLHLKKFIHYNNGSLNFVHQIIPSLSFSSRGSISMQNLFNESLGAQSIRLKQIPLSFLILRMPFQDWKLVGYQDVVPSPSLRVYVDDGNTVELRLHAVICATPNGNYSIWLRGLDSDRWIRKTAESINPFPDSLTKELQHYGSTSNFETLGPEAKFMARMHFISIYEYRSPKSSTNTSVFNKLIESLI